MRCAHAFANVPIRERFRNTAIEASRAKRSLKSEVKSHVHTLVQHAQDHHGFFSNLVENEVPAHRMAAIAAPDVVTRRPDCRAMEQQREFLADRRHVLRLSRCTPFLFTVARDGLEIAPRDMGNDKPHQRPAKKASIC